MIVNSEKIDSLNQQMVEKEINKKIVSSIRKFVRTLQNGNKSVEIENFTVLRADSVLRPEDGTHLVQIRAKVFLDDGVAYMPVMIETKNQYLSQSGAITTYIADGLKKLGPTGMVNQWDLWYLSQSSFEKIKNLCNQ